MSVCYVQQVYGCLGDHKKAFDPLELELKTVLSHQIWVLGPKLGSSGGVGSKRAKPLSHLSNPLTNASYAFVKIQHQLRIKSTSETGMRKKPITESAYKALRLTSLCLP